VKEQTASRRRRSIFTAAVSVAAVVLAVVVARGTGSNERHDLLARGALAACLLVLGWQLFAAVRGGLKAQRAAPLDAPSRGEWRSAVAPGELLRIRADVARARESREQFEKSLKRRLRSLAERRAAIAAGRKNPGASEERPARGESGKGPSVGELGEIVRSIEEL
jgi:hypothetical protein